MKRFKVHGLLFVLFHQFLRIKCSCQDVEIPRQHSEDNQEFFTPDSQNFQSEQFENDPLGLNFEQTQTESQTEFFKDETSTTPTTTTNNISEFSSSEKISPVDEREKVKIIFNSYQNEFDRRYSLKSNYSEIFREIQSSIGNYSNPFNLNNYSFSSFPNLYEVYEYLSFLQNFANGRAIILPLRQYNGSWHNVHTNLGNEILSIRISSKPLESHEQNPIIVVVAGIHGRDWYAIQSAIFLATELIRNGNRTMTDNIDWWIFPILNPDGYEITKKHPKWRNWEKNLYGTQHFNTDECFGIDLDLNFEYQWLSCNDSICDPNFPGLGPFTTPETQGLRDTLDAYSDYCDSFIALKEGKQCLVFPFSDTLEAPRNVEDLEKICQKAVDAFAQCINGFYDYGPSSYLIGLRAGYIEDWAKVHLGIEKSFSFYLGPRIEERREMKSEHVMDHLNGTFNLLDTIAKEKVLKKVSQSSCNSFHSSLLRIAINFLIIRYFL